MDTPEARIEKPVQVASKSERLPDRLPWPMAAAIVFILVLASWGFLILAFHAL